jgi:diaminohydroxyphosphoribosylaminopyrimidine deaminase/5-amino-6-(5-phosphoribosylamino)uracil reductase
MEQSRTENAMRHALDLASRGPAVGGNPQVGCVLLDPDGTIVAEGWHRGAGTPHAEIDALSRVDSAAGLTAVVTLEPCNHTGRTGPCSEALIAAGVAEVFYAVSDPSPIAGGGAERLTASGIPSSAGVLADEVTEFLRPWLIATALRRPFVTVKWASTLDGRTAATDGTSQWITGTAARQRVHEQREAHDAILVGTGTALADDPALTARGDAGELMEHQPIPVVVGLRALPDDAQLRRHPAGLIETRSRDLPAILTDLFDRGIRRVFVEGGPRLASALVAADLVDDFAIYLAPLLLGGDRLAIGDIGVDTLAAGRRLQITGVENLGNDLLVLARATPAPATQTPATPATATSHPGTPAPATRAPAVAPIGTIPPVTSNIPAGIEKE